ncbi:MAG TPA: TRAP transporter large permease subunit [Gammaproteobacteria bacterium]|nr:TRAP transporter large permease subunit [Gammaproteobacteria bacterium]
MTLLVAIALVAIILLGAPLFAAIGASAMLGFGREGTDLSIVPIEFYGIAETSVLLAIPLFTFAGFLLSKGNAPRRLVRLSEAALGWLPGGLAIVSLAACALFTAFTGASGVTIIALGAVLFPALVASGYSDKFSLGLITTSGSLGLLFAPSLPLILYGIIAEVAIDDLFLAGIIPGTLMVVLLAVYSYWRNRGRTASKRRVSMAELKAAVVDARYELPLAPIVLGGIYSGFFAVSEAAAVTAVYVIGTEFLLRREISLRDLPEIVRESMILVGAIFMILGLSLASTSYMIDIEVPQRLFELVSRYVASEGGFLVGLLLFLLVVGAILDIFSAIVLVVPLIVPVAIEFGIHPVHLGIVFLAAMELGYMTPPVGLNLFISSYRFERDIAEVYSATLPFLLVLLVCVLLIAFLPQLSLFLLS